MPVATFCSTDSVEAPSQAYSQSWIVPAPLVARCVSQPAGHHPLEDPRGAVAEQVGAVDQHHGRAAAAGPPGSPPRRLRPSATRDRGTAAAARRDRSGSRRPASGSSRGQREDPELGQVERLDSHRRLPIHRISMQIQSWLIGLRPRSRGSAAEQVIDERDGVAEVGDDGVGADAQQPPALPLVDPAGAVVGLVAGDGHGQAADLLGVLDLDVAVAEGEQLPAGDPVLAGGCGR